MRSGGHNIAGNAVCDGGLMIDLSLMRSVRVDRAAKRAWVEPGATLADVDKETLSFGLVLPTGINSTTGIAGLTLGGGFGWITRKFGLTIDNLLSADVVTADGELLRASPAENPDLFWALRGGGGNFGIVTSFECAELCTRTPVFIGDFPPRRVRQRMFGAVRLAEGEGFETVVRLTFKLTGSGSFGQNYTGITPSNEANKRRYCLTY